MTWTDERIALLKQLWTRDGLSAGQIAATLGVTRNAVIGKVHRLGLVQPYSPPRPRTFKVKLPSLVRPAGEGTYKSNLYFARHYRGNFEL